MSQVHKFSMNGRCFAASGSGAIHELSPLAYALVDFLDVNETVLLEAFIELKALKDQGLLFSEPVNMEQTLNAQETVVKALCLHVTHGCNLSCRYCFAGDGKYHGDDHLMTEEVGKAAVDFLIQNSGNRHNLEIDFFGGEPLMNFDVVKAVVAYGNEQAEKAGKRFRFTITTNGLLLTPEISDFINKHMDNVVLSLDGRVEVNDALRRTKDGRGSFEFVAQKFLDLVAKRDKSYFVRGTFTKKNLDFAKDVEFLLDMGFRHVSVEPVVSTDPELAITSEDLPVIINEYKKLAALLLERRKQGRDADFFHFNIDLEHGPCAYKRIKGCGAGTEYVAVAPSGDIFPCHQFVGIDEFKMGKLGEFNPGEIGQKFRSTNMFSKEECRDCWAKMFCGGGCAANGYFSKGDILDVYEIGCEMHKCRTECAIMMKSEELE